MAITINTLQAMTTKGIEAKGGVRDAVFLNNAYLKRLRKNQKVWSGEKLTIPFIHNENNTTGGYYVGAESLAAYNVEYDNVTELAFDLIELQETLVIAHRDLAKNQSDAGKLKLLTQKLEIMEKALRERFSKGIFSDGTAATGALTTKQFIGQRAFLKNTAVNYGGITNTDVSVHVAYVNSNGGVDRALTTALIQKSIGGASEGDERPTLGVMVQGVMDEFIELIAPHQRTTRENLNGLGHDSNVLVYSGIDHIVDNHAIAKSIAYLNEKYVNLYAATEYDMKRQKVENLEEKDALMQRLFYKGAYISEILRRNALLTDITVTA